LSRAARTLRSGLPPGDWTWFVEVCVLIHPPTITRFLQLLALDPAAAQTWQVFADRKGADVRPEHRHATLADAAPWLNDVQRNGGGVFWTVQATDGQGRKAANVTSIRHLYVDCDNGLPNSWHVEPAVVVESSPGKQHAYWVLADAVDAATFLAAQKRLIAHYGSDPSCHDLPRVLRVPGTWHQKGEPCKVQIVAESPWGIYQLADVMVGVAELPRVAPAPDAATVAARAARVLGGLRDAIDVATLDVVRLFSDQGLLLDTQRNGGFAVVCPWSGEHSSDTSPTAAMVWPAGVKGDLPGFKCLHGHCDGRGIKDVMRMWHQHLEHYAQSEPKPHPAVVAAEARRMRANGGAA
jgi:hypothetical protein